VKTYIEEFLTTFSGFHQMVFSFLIAYRLQQLFPQLTAHSNFFHSHSPTKQTLNSIPTFFSSLCFINPSFQRRPKEWQNHKEPTGSLSRKIEKCTVNYNYL
jgi:hypothetical protein